MSNAFQNLRDKLREAGCEMQCSEQIKTAHGAMIELWLAYRPGDGIPVRFMVIDEHAEGYHLFIENPSNRIDDDVAALLSGPAHGRLEKVA